MKHTWKGKRIALLLLALTLAFASAGCARMAWVADPAVSGAGGTGTSSERPMPNLSVNGGETSKPFNPTMEQVEGWIKLAFLKKYPEAAGYTVDDLSVRFVGTFDGFYAVFVDGALDYATVAGTEYVKLYDMDPAETLVFRYKTAQHLLLYRGSALYTITEADNIGLFTAEELREIHNAYCDANKELYRDDKIKTAFLKKTGSDASIEQLSVQYVTSFRDDGYAVFVEGPFDGMHKLWSEVVNGLEFFYSIPSQQILFYRGGELYTLQEAFDSHVISEDELLGVYLAHRSMDHVTLKETQRVKEAYLRMCASDPETAGGWDHDLFSTDLLSVRYLAMDGDVYVVSVLGLFFYANIPSTETVGDLEFRKPSSQPLLLYRGGEMWSLQEAFETGIISREELSDLYEGFRASFSHLYTEEQYAGAYWRERLQGEPLSSLSEEEFFALLVGMGIEIPDGIDHIFLKRLLSALETNLELQDGSDSGFLRQLYEDVRGVVKWYYEIA